MTEAAIELRYEGLLDRAVLERAAARLNYAVVETEMAQTVNLDTQTGTASFSANWQGIKLSSADRTEVVIFRAGALVIGHLAPHKGWDYLLETTKNAWLALAHVSDENLALARVGVRYINRIDVPAVEGQPSTFDYVQLQFVKPDGLNVPDRISEFSFLLAYAIPNTQFETRIITATNVSPLILHNAIILDIDVFQANSIPRRTDALWDLLGELRARKNEIFEASITDRARELFE